MIYGKNSKTRRKKTASKGFVHTLKTHTACTYKGNKSKKEGVEAEQARALYVQKYRPKSEKWSLKTKIIYLQATSLDIQTPEKKSLLYNARVN